MTSSTPHQLFLLADHLKLSLLERQRAIALKIPAEKQDSAISRSLTSFRDGLEVLESPSSSGDPADVAKLRTQYQDLYTQFHGSAPPSAPNDPTLAKDFDAVQKKPAEPGRNKNVRFRDNPDDEEVEDPVAAANRAALFSDTARYRDEPEAPDQTGMDNQQIHAYHSQVLQEQDAQLDLLGQSVGRTRILGIQMGSELDEQAELLEDVERGVDRHSSTLERAQKRLGHIARKSKDNWNWVVIGILICILVLLIIVLKAVFNSTNTHSGGTKGIGRAIVRSFLAEGSIVYFCSRTALDVAAANTKLAADFPNTQAHGTAVDISKSDALKSWVEECAQQSGRIDVVVANASAIATKDVLDHWKTAFETDILGCWHLIQTALPYLEKAKGNIITISSVSGRDVDFTAPGPYGALKAGLVHYTQQLAHRLAPKGIRANVCSPGNIYIEDGVFGEIEREHPEFFKEQMARNPMGRMGTAEEIADSVLFLASERAGFVSGANFVVDGALCTGVQL
nr:isoepoxydon dehydrogenase patn [Quercus suber]